LTDKPARVLVLEEAASLTGGERDLAYGPPITNLSASGDLKDMMRYHMVRDLSSAELEALDMVLTKIGRIITGPLPKRDNYVDAAAYMAIAWEAAQHDMDYETLNRTVNEMFHPTGGVVWHDDDDKLSDA
jgi:hypothetical protein